jgi:hypothetical protein
MIKDGDTLQFYEDEGDDDDGVFVATSRGLGMAQIDLPVFIDYLRAHYPQYLEDKNVATAQDNR